MSELSGRFRLEFLLEEAGFVRSTYHYALSHSRRQTGPKLWDSVRGIFSRTPNGMGHRQIAMCLKGEEHVAIADKTVLKMMHEVGRSCGTRGRAPATGNDSHKGKVDKTFKNLIKRDFQSAPPFENLGTDVTEFRQPWSKAHLAPIYDFATKEIVVWSISEHPDTTQQAEHLDRFMERLPEGSYPVLHPDMDWQYQNEAWCSRFEKAYITQSMSKKSNCLDSAETEQVFGHLKDEFFRGREWPDFESFKCDLDAYIVYWNTRRRHVSLKGLTQEKFRNQALAI